MKKRNLTEEIISNAAKTYDPRELYNADHVFKIPASKKRSTRRDSPDRNKKIRIK